MADYQPGNVAPGHNEGSHPGSPEKWHGDSQSDRREREQNVDTQCCRDARSDADLLDQPAQSAVEHAWNQPAQEVGQQDSPPLQIQRVRHLTLARKLTGGHGSRSKRILASHLSSSCLNQWSNRHSLCITKCRMSSQTR